MNPHWNAPAGPPSPPAYHRYPESQGPRPRLPSVPSHPQQTFTRYPTATRPPVRPSQSRDPRVHLGQVAPSLLTPWMPSPELSADELFRRFGAPTDISRREWEFQTGLHPPFREGENADRYLQQTLSKPIFTPQQGHHSLGRSHPATIPGRQSSRRSPPISARAFATPSTHPIQRSWTLDSPSRSSLAPLEPTHAGRPITLDPSFRPEDVVITEDFNSWDPGNQGYRADRIGGPPKAKLGGPGGKTYEELRAGDQRIVSAPASTPPPRSKRQSADPEDAEGTGKKKEDGKWNSQTIAVRLPISSDIPLPTPSPLDLQDLVSMPSKRIEGKIGSPSGEVDLSRSSRTGCQEASSRYKVVPKIKEVIVAAPTNDTRIVPSSRQTSRRASRAGNPDDTPRLQYNNDPNPHGQSSHQNDSSVSSSLTNYLDASASSFIPVYPILTSGEVPPPLRSNSGRLRPYAPPFQPTLLNRRVVTSAVSGVTSEILGSRRLTTRRSVSDIGSEGPKKRLRPSAPAFQPTRSRPHFRSSFARSENPYSALWQTSTLLDAGPSDERDQGMGDEEDTSQRLDTSLPFQFGQTSFSFGSIPSPNSANSKRSASGALRPAAPSFVPSSGAFTFRATPPPTNRYWIIRSETEEPKEENKEEGESSVMPNSSGGGRKSASPASRLHDLPDYEADLSQSGEMESGQVEMEDREVEMEQGDQTEDAPSTLHPSQLVESPVPPSAFHLKQPSSSAPSPSEDVLGPTSPQGENIEVGNIAYCPIPLETLPTPSKAVVPLSDFIPHTPISSAPTSNRAATTEPYETADGSPLVPQRHMKTPDTPHKTAMVESKIPLLSPTPARHTPFRLSISSQNHSPKLLLPDIDGPQLLLPKMARSGVKSAEAKETDFRNWVFPASPSSSRPQLTRRFTFPVPTGDEASLAGIASTPTNREIQPIMDEPLPMDSGVIPTESSSRTSVEFPMRPEVKRKLTVTNDVSDEEVDLGTARPTLPIGNSEEGKEEGLRVYLVRIEGMLRSIEERPNPGPNDRSREAISELGKEMAGMIAEWKSSLEDRLAEFAQPSTIDHTAELHDQRQLLTELLNRSKSTSSTHTQDFDAAVASLLTGQTTILELVNTKSSSQIQQIDEVHSVTEALKSIVEDLELRKASEEKKEEVIIALRDQAEDARKNEMKAIMERDTMKENVQQSDITLQQLKKDKEELLEQIRTLEEGGQRDSKRTDGLEASQMAIISERDGLAKALTDSFRRQTELEAEADRLAKELEVEKSEAALSVSRDSSSLIQFQSLAASNQAFQDKLLDQLQQLTLSANIVDEARSTELEGLRADKRSLQNEGTDLRKKTYDSASKIAESDLRLATASNTASALEAELRKSLATVEKAKMHLEKKVTDLEIVISRLGEEKLNLGTIATERSGAMRIIEIRHQALIQENVFWREFALSYDRREHRKYTQSQPFRRKTPDLASDPAHTSTPKEPVPVDSNPNNLHTELDVPVTPSKSTFDQGSGSKLELETRKHTGVNGTPDLSMSASSSAEGIVRVADTPDGQQRGEGTWWDIGT